MMGIKGTTLVLLGALALIGTVVVVTFMKYFLITVGVLTLLFLMRWDSKRKKRNTEEKT